MTEFTAAGNSVYLYAVVGTSTLNTVTISADISDDGGTTYHTLDKTWTFEGSTGNHSIHLSGINLIPGVLCKLYYQCETAGGGELQVDMLNWDNPGGSGGSLDVATGTEGDASDDEGLPIVFEAKTSQKSAVDDGDWVIPVTNDHGETVVAGFNWTSEYVAVGEIEPIYTKGVPTEVVAETNGTDGTYDYFIDVTQVHTLALHGVLDGGSGTVTVTLEATSEPSTAAASCSYVDVTQYGFSNMGGADAASYTADFYVCSKPELRARYIHIQVVASTGGADDADWTIYAFDPAI
jgi:hypothetical protein